MITETEPTVEKPHAYSGGWDGRSRYVVVILTVIYALNFLDRQILALMLPQIKRDLQLSDSQLGLISGFAFVLFYSILGLPIARLADRSSRQRILAIGLTFWTLMTAATGMVRNVWQLALTRFLMGAGEATGLAPTHSMVADIFSQARRPFALAIVTAGNSLSALVFFPAVGWIGQQYGWRTVFYVAGIFGLIIAAIFYLTVPEPVRVAGKTGAVKVQEKFWTTLRFLLSSRAYLFTVIGGALMGIALYAGQAWHPTFLTRVHHLSLVQIGASYGIVRGIMGLIGAVLGGLLADRLGRRDPRWRLWTAGLACILFLAAEFVFLFAPLRLSLVGLGLTSLFAGMHFGPVYAVCQGVARSTMRATSAAFFLLVVNLVGQVVGPFSVGYLNDRWAAAYGDGAIRYSLILGAVCACLGGILMLAGAGSLGRDTARAEE
jgi:MFS family permease